MEVQFKDLLKLLDYISKDNKPLSIVEISTLKASLDYLESHPDEKLTINGHFKNKWGRIINEVKDAGALI